MFKRVLILIAVAGLIFGGLAVAKYRQIQALKAHFSRPQPPTQVAAVTVESHTHYNEHYFWFVWAALALLLIEALWMNGLRVKIP